jgi:hypothetical protein
VPEVVYEEEDDDEEEDSEPARVSLRPGRRVADDDEYGDVSDDAEEEGGLAGFSKWGASNQHTIGPLSWQDVDEAQLNEESQELWENVVSTRPQDKSVLNSIFQAVTDESTKEVLDPLGGGAIDLTKKRLVSAMQACLMGSTGFDTTQHPHCCHVAGTPRQHC